MTNKILELTEKIYNEGIEKAKSKAGDIIEKANNEADDVIKAANAKSKEIIEQAENQAAEIRKNTESELQMAARNFMSKIKQQITELITTAQVAPSVKKAFDDNNFIINIITTIIKNWNPQKPEDLNISLLLPKEDEKELNAFFEKEAKEYLNKGVEVNFDSNIKGGFKIGPRDGSYLISFTEKDFENYFKSYIKDRTRELIFETPSQK